MLPHVTQKNSDWHLNSDSLCKDSGVTRRVGTFGYFGRGNIGDEILLQTLQTNRYNISFEPLSKMRIHGTSQIASSMYNYSLILPNKIRVKYLENKFKGFDSALLGPGGLVSLYRFHPWCDSLYGALKERRVPLYCYGLGVEPDDLDNAYGEVHSETIQKWRQLLSLSETIYVRDNFSRELLQANDIHDNVVIVNDLTFAYPLPLPLRKDEKIVGINMRTKFVKDADIFTDKQQLLGIIDFFVDLGYKILLIPFQTRRSKNETENDLVILDEIYHKTKHKDKIRVVRHASPTEVLQHISYLDFFVGTRYHSVLFALRYGIPTCAIAYRPKVRSLMEEYYGLGEYVVAPNQVSVIKELFMDREKIRSRALSRTPEIERTTMEQVGRFLSSLLSY